MQFRPLGQTDVQVSVICLGTMTWGEQNTEEEAHQQMDCALEMGVNFFDTAEMYPVPPKAETYGRTEQYIGTWFASRNNRDKVILATKIAAPAMRLSYVRDGNLRLNRHNVQTALNASLQRLKTDYIDLYQLHWPDREVNNFGQLGYVHNPHDQFTSFEETLEALAEQVQAGKIRHIGVSNETPWGVMKFMQVAKERGWPRMVSIQNPYSLLNRSFEVGLSEVAIREQCGLLAYSPMGFGVLSGKYLNGDPGKSRIKDYPQFDRYNNPTGVEATRRYVDIAHRHGLNPAQMSLAFVNSRDFVTSNIIGATTLDQLRQNIESINVHLNEDVLREINQVQRDISNPCP